MRLGHDTFRGEAPRIAPQNLPENGAQAAVNCRLVSGDLEAFGQFVTTKVLANAGPVPTISLLNGSWLSFDSQTDIARGLIPGDNTFLSFLTNPNVYSTPRYTTFALATTGAEPYPVTTKPLGVPAPTIAPHGPAGIGTPPEIGVDTSGSGLVIDVTDAGDEIESWTLPAPQNPHLGRLTVEESAVTGNPAPSYHFECDRGDDSNSHSAFMYRDFGLASASTISYVADFLMHGAIDSDRRVMCVHVANEVDGNGITVWYDNVTNPELNIGVSAGGWRRDSLNSYASASVGAPVFPGPLDEEKWYRIEVTVDASSATEQTVTAKLYDGAALVATVAATNAWVLGNYCGQVFHVYDDSAAESSGAYYDNIHVTASGTRGLTIINVATSYVYTFVNTVSGTTIRWESAPSPASSTILRPDGVSVTVTTETSHGYDAEYGIDAKRLYRAVTGATGTIYLFVAEIPLATADYVDVLDDSELGEALESTDWDLPPAQLQGILTLPNGIMAGFVRNELCLSAQGRPHAWPVAFRLPTDTDIVGITNIDNSLVIGTKSLIYLATGNDPANYSMSRQDDFPQSCVAKRSFATVSKFGAVFASPDGLIAGAGPGQFRNLTEMIFTRKQWQALDPTSIIAVAHDDIYFFSFTGTAPDSSYAIDLKPSGFGLIALSSHFIAAHADPITDKLYLVVDVNAEPTDGSLPLPSTAITASNKTIFEFNAHATDKMVFRWRGRLNLMPYPAGPQVAQVQAADYANLVAKFYGDGALIYTKVIASAQEFTLPTADAYSTFEVELIGTSRVRRIQVSEDVFELA